MDPPVQVFGLLPALFSFVRQTPNFRVVTHAPRIIDGDELSTGRSWQTLK
jgi:hypothetical protein